MKYLQFTSYIYLFFAAICCYEAVNQWSMPGNKGPLMAGFAGVSLFLYFFRRHFAKKMGRRQ